MADAEQKVRAAEDALADLKKALTCDEGRRFESLRPDQ
jgi:hypothetical protein